MIPPPPINVVPRRLSKAERAHFVLKLILTGYLMLTFLTSFTVAAMWLNDLPAFITVWAALLTFCGPVAAAGLFAFPTVGRVLVIISQVLQSIALICPWLGYQVFMGLVLTAGFSILPIDGKWTFRPEYEFKTGGGLAGWLGRVDNPDLGYAVVFNLVPLAVTLLAYFGLKTRAREE